MRCAVLEKPFDTLTLEQTLEICCNKESSKKTGAEIAVQSMGVDMVQTKIRRDMSFARLLVGHQEWNTQ